MSIQITIQRTLGLRMEPLDVLFFREGKPFVSGSEYMVSGLPLPQTFAGAIRTALLRLVGCDFSRLKQEINNQSSIQQAIQLSCPNQFHWVGDIQVRGPWLAREEKSEIEVFIPAPAILHKPKQPTQESNTLYRLSPLPANNLPGWNPLSGQENLRPLWLKQMVSTETVSGYLTKSGLEKFLRGYEVDANDLVSHSDLYILDYRTGIGISPERLVAEKSQIFGRGFLALKENVFLYGEVRLPDETPERAGLDSIDLLAFGGENRHVKLQCMDQSYDWPIIEPINANQKPLILLTTPCVCNAGWKPQCLNGRIAAAAVPGSIAFSGWDLARGGPKPTRFAVPAGSVYFLDSLPDSLSDSLAETEEEQRQGWGCYLKGVWNDE